MSDKGAWQWNVSVRKIGNQISGKWPLPPYARFCLCHVSPEFKLRSRVASPSTQLSIGAGVPPIVTSVG